MVQATIERPAVTTPATPAPQAIADALWRAWRETFPSAVPVARPAFEPLWSNVYPVDVPEFRVLVAPIQPQPAETVAPESLTAEEFLGQAYL